MKKIISMLLIGVLINVTACGTVLYPERKGQIDGRIDPGIVILDGVGLFFFIIPGVIAYAVDFATGTIYLPGGKKHHSSLEINLSVDGMQAVHIGKENLTKQNIQTAIYDHTGKVVNMNDPNIKTYKAGTGKV